MASLNTLPPEIMTHIIQLTDPGSHLDLACTSRFVSQCADEVFKRHCEAKAEWSEVTDVEPLSIPILLRIVLRDSIVAWHVRKLEFWGNRCAWTQWRSFRYARKGVESLEERFCDGPSLSWDFRDDEVREYLELMRSVLLLDEDTIETAWHDMEKGCDGPLKVLLMSLCPRLTTLQYVRGVNYDEDSETIKDSSISYLQKTLVKLSSNDSLSWPAGLMSMSCLSVGVASASAFDDMPYSHKSDVMADFLKFPNLESLYYRGHIQSKNEQGVEYEHTVTKRSFSFPSSCPKLRRLFLDGGGVYDNREDDSSADFKGRLFNACHNLESIALRDLRISYVENIPKAFGRQASSALHSFMLYGCELSGYRCRVYDPEACKSLFKLRHVTVDIHDIMLFAYGRHMHDPDTGDQDRDEAGHEFIEDHDYFVNYMTNLFPASLEVLILISYDRLSKPDAIFVDDAVAAMFEPGQYSNLKAVYLMPLAEDGVFNPNAERWNKEHFSFPTATAAARKYAIDVHTSWESELHHQVDLPTAPGPLDLIAGPLAPIIRETVGEAQSFDPYKGHWRRS